MNKKKIITIFILFITVSLLSYFILPTSFRTEGGSCYQGITVVIDHFFLIICSTINTISFITVFLKSKKDTGFLLSCISLIIWFLWFFINLIGSLYNSLFLLPYLIISIVIVRMHIKLIKQIKNLTHFTIDSAFNN